eukprot:c12980_g1_i1.p1 GENE.c12980_g1_i1~~c12980_g1_i1.p1  ORF type:complete len:2907 (-),score=745.20 c12980_g1_i1:59-8779(-)
MASMPQPCIVWMLMLIVVAVAKLSEAVPVVVRKAPNFLETTLDLETSVQDSNDVALTDLERAMQKADEIQEFQNKVAQLTGVSESEVEILEMNSISHPNDQKTRSRSVHARIHTKSPQQTDTIQKLLNPPTVSKPRDLEMTTTEMFENNSTATAVSPPRVNFVSVRTMVGDPVFWNSQRPNWMVLLVEVADTAFTSVHVTSFDNDITVEVAGHTVRQPFGESDPISLHLHSPVKVVVTASRSVQQQHVTYTLGLLRAVPTFTYRLRLFLEQSPKTTTTAQNDTVFSGKIEVAWVSKVLEQMGLQSAGVELVATALDSSGDGLIDFNEFYWGHVIGLIPAADDGTFTTVSRELSTAMHSEWLSIRLAPNKTNFDMSTFWNNRYGFSPSISTLLTAQLTNIRQQLHPHGSLSEIPTELDLFRMAASGILPLSRGSSFLEKQLTAFVAMEESKHSDDCLERSEIKKVLEAAGFSEEQREWVASGMFSVHDAIVQAPKVRKNGRAVLCMGVGAFVRVDVAGYFPIAAVVSEPRDAVEKSIREEAIIRVSKAIQAFQNFPGFEPHASQVPLREFQSILESQFQLTTHEARLLLSAIDHNEDSFINAAEYAGVILSGMLVPELPQVHIQQQNLENSKTVRDLEKSQSTTVTRCTVSNEACSFPFEYQGRIVRDCITDTPPPMTITSNKSNATDVLEHREGWCAVCGVSCGWCGKWSYCKSREHSSDNCRESSTATEESSKYDVWPISDRESASVDSSNRSKEPEASSASSVCGGKRTFSNPSVDVVDEQARALGSDVRALDWCNEQSCGQEVADRFCRTQSIDGETTFSKAATVTEDSDRVEASSTTELDGRICSSNCATFKSIMCLLPPCSRSNATTSTTTSSTEHSHQTESSMSAATKLMKVGEVVTIESSTTPGMFLAISGAESSVVAVSEMQDAAKWKIEKDQEDLHFPGAVMLRHLTTNKFLVISEEKPSELSSTASVAEEYSPWVVIVHEEPSGENPDRAIVSVSTGTGMFLALDINGKVSLQNQEGSATTRLRWTVLRPSEHSSNQQKMLEADVSDRSNAKSQDKDKKSVAQIWKNQLDEHSTPEGSKEETDSFEKLALADDALDENEQMRESKPSKIDPAILTAMDDHDRSLHLAEAQKRKLYSPELQKVSVQYLQDIIRTYLQFMRTSENPSHPYISRKELVSGLQILSRSMEYAEAYKIAMVVDNDDSGKIGLSEFSQAVDLALIPQRGNSSDPSDFFLPADERSRIVNTRGYGNIEDLYQKYKGPASITFPRHRMIESLQQYGLSVESSRFLASQIDRRGKDEISFEDFLHAALWGLVPRHQLMARELEMAVQTFLYFDTDKDNFVQPKEVSSGLVRQGFEPDFATFTGNTVEANFGETRPPTFKWLHWLMSKGIIPSLILEGSDDATVQYRADMRNRMILIIQTFDKYSSNSKSMKQPELMAALINGGMNREEARFFSKLPFFDYNDLSVYQFASIISFKKSLLIKPSSLQSQTMLKDPRAFSIMRSTVRSFQEDYSGSGDTISLDNIATALQDNFKWKHSESSLVAESLVHSFARLQIGSDLFEIPHSVSELSKCKDSKKFAFEMSCSSEEDSKTACYAPFDICWVEVAKSEDSKQPCKFGFTFDKSGPMLTVYSGCSANFSVTPFESENFAEKISFRMFSLAMMSNVLPMTMVRQQQQNGNAPSTSSGILATNNVVQAWKVYCSLAGYKETVDYGASSTNDRIVDKLLEYTLSENELREIYRSKAGQMTRAVVKYLLKFFETSQLFDQNLRMSFYRFVRGRTLQTIPDPDNDEQMTTIAQDVQMFSMCSILDNRRFPKFVTLSSLRNCLLSRGMRNDTTEFFAHSLFAPFPPSFKSRGLTFDQFRWATGGKFFPRDLVPNLNLISFSWDAFLNLKPEEKGVKLSRLSESMQQQGWPVFYVEAVLRATDSDKNGFISFFEFWNALRTKLLLFGELHDGRRSDPDSVLAFFYHALQLGDSQDPQIVSGVHRFLKDRGFNDYKINTINHILEQSDDSRLKQIVQLLNLGLFSYNVRSQGTITYHQDWMSLIDALSCMHTSDVDESGGLSETEFVSMLRDFLPENNLQILWEIVDTNGDGEIDILEWLVARDLTLTLTRQNGIRLLERLTWLDRTFVQYDTDDKDALTVNQIRQMAPAQNAKALDVSIMLIISASGIQAKIQRKQFFKMVLEGSIMTRELEDSPLQQLVEDIQQYYYSVKGERAEVSASTIASRLSLREGYSEREALLITSTAFIHKDDVDIYEFTSAVMRQVLVIPLSMSKEQIRILETTSELGSRNNYNAIEDSDTFSNPKTTASNNTLTPLTMVASVKNIQVSGTISVTTPFSSNMANAFEVNVATGLTEVTVAVTFDASQKVTINEWNLISGEPSPPIALLIKQPTAIYVKVIPTNGASRVYTVIINVDTSQQAHTRCTSNEGGDRIENRICIFPFESPAGSGTKHYNCIPDERDSQHREWCITGTRTLGEWGYCKPEGDATCPQLQVNSNHLTHSNHNGSQQQKGNETKNQKKLVRNAKRVLELELKSFRLLGASQEGRLPVSVLEAGLEHMGMKSDVAKLVSQVTDVNGDGDATFFEVVRSIRLGLLPGLDANDRGRNLQLILKMHREFAESGTSGISVSKIRRLLVNQVHVSGGMAKIIVGEIDVDNDGTLSKLELMRGAHRGLIPLAGGRVQKQFKDIADAYERFALAVREGSSKPQQNHGADHTTTSGNFETWGISSPLLAMELRDSLMLHGLSKIDVSILVKAVAIDLSTKAATSGSSKDLAGDLSVAKFSSFLSVCSANLIPKSSMEVEGVKRNIAILKRMFENVAGKNQQTVSVAQLTTNLVAQLYAESDAHLIAESCTLDLTSQSSIDVVLFVRAYVEGIVPVEELWAEQSQQQNNFLK